MIRVTLALGILKHVQAESLAFEAATIAEALSRVFKRYQSPGHLLDDRAGRHQTILVNNQAMCEALKAFT